MENKLVLTDISSTRKVYTGYGYQVSVSYNQRQNIPVIFDVKIVEMEYFKPSIDVHGRDDINVITSAFAKPTDFIRYMKVLAEAFACAEEIERRYDEMISKNGG